VATKVARGTVIPRGTAVPHGICGSGLIDFLACALETGVVKADGSLAPACADRGVLLEPSGRLALSAADVRNLQLAKAAVAAGIGALMERSGVSARDVARVHLAGGFGLALREESAFAIGLLPSAFASRVVRHGNASLAGAARSLCDPGFDALLSDSIDAGTVLQLADSPTFGRLFLDSMALSPT